MDESARELEGRVAIVTGSGRNIGRAIALALAAGGAAVVVNTRTNRTEADDVARDIERSGGKALACLADVADAAHRKAPSRMTAMTARQSSRVNWSNAFSSRMPACRR